MTDESNLQKKIRSHLALLYDREEGSVGSGILVRAASRIFVLTAAHVLFDHLQINLGLPWQRSPLTILDQWTDPSLDIAFIELKPFEVEMLRHDNHQPYVVHKKVKTYVQHMKKTLVLCGYPAHLHTHTDNGVAFTPLFLVCVLLGPDDWPSFLKERKDPTCNFAVPCGPKYGVHFRDEQKQIMRLYPKGMSGCGLWLYDPQTEHTESASYSLLGILHSHFPQDELLVGTFADRIFDVLNERYGPFASDPEPTAPSSTR
jgi:hypothetical protein